MITQKQPIAQKKQTEMVTELMDAGNELPMDHVVIQSVNNAEERSKVQRVYDQFRMMYPNSELGHSHRINYVSIFENDGAALAFQKMAIRAGLDASLHTDDTYLSAYEPSSLHARVHQSIVNAFG